MSLHSLLPTEPVTFGTASATTSIDVVATRGDLVESRHRVHAAVVDASGRLLLTARDPNLVTWWRSCAKPFQVMPLLDCGGFDALAWGDDELALACASHGGEPEHVAIAASMLTSLGLEEGDLACGPHDPLTSRGLRLLRDAGTHATRLHNNCSGKHAAMLAYAKSRGVPIAEYNRVEHPVQTDIAQVVVQWAGVQGEALQTAIDGCAVAVFGMPLANMALAYARLAAASRDNTHAAARIVGAMTSAPFLVGGTDRFDTLLMDAGDGNIVCKIGAEGVHCLALLDRSIGIAVKVEDGSPRAQFPAVIALLRALDALPPVLPDALAEMAVKPLRNTRGDFVGEVRIEHEQRIDR